MSRCSVLGWVIQLAYEVNERARLIRDVPWVLSLAVDLKWEPFRHSLVHYPDAALQSPGVHPAGTLQSPPDPDRPNSLISITRALSARLPGRGNRRAGAQLQ